MRPSRSMAGPAKNGIQTRLSLWILWIIHILHILLSRQIPSSVRSGGSSRVWEPTSPSLKRHSSRSKNRFRLSNWRTRVGERDGTPPHFAETGRRDAIMPRTRETYHSKSGNPQMGVFRLPIFGKIMRPIGIRTRDQAKQPYIVCVEYLVYVYYTYEMQPIVELPPGKIPALGTFAPAGSRLRPWTTFHKPLYFD